jgi:hypothetical protein
VRINGRRKKKLAVAFQFQFANQAAWKCDSCRKSGLQHKRKCGWLPKTDGTDARIVWARGRTTAAECPVSYITADSRSFLEQFHVRKEFGWGNVDALPSRVVEAFHILENEFQTEKRSGQT